MIYNHLGDGLLDVPVRDFLDYFNWHEKEDSRAWAVKVKRASSALPA